jgi:hypothetical protein
MVQARIIEAIAGILKGFSKIILILIKIAYHGSL